MGEGVPGGTGGAAFAADSRFAGCRLDEKIGAGGAAAVDDPHIIPVHETAAASGVLFTAIRYVSGWR